MWTVTEPIADFLFNASNLLLIFGATAVLIGTVGSIAMGGAKEQFANERVAANVAETAVAKSTAAQADERAANANVRAAALEKEAAQLHLDVAAANAKALEAQLARKIQSSSFAE